MQTINNRSEQNEHLWTLCIIKNKSMSTWATSTSSDLWTLIAMEWGGKLLLILSKITNQNWNKYLSPLFSNTYPDGEINLWISWKNPNREFFFTSIIKKWIYSLLTLHKTSFQTATSISKPAFSHSSSNKKSMFFGVTAIRKR